MPLNEKVMGKKYPSRNPVEITAHESIYYALAYNEDNDAYFDNRRPGGIIAPPMFAVFYASDPTVQIIFDKETGMNFMMVVHYTQEFEWLAPVRPGDKVTTDGSIIQIETKEKGGILGWESVTKNQRGEEVVKARWAFFDRSAGSGKPEEKKPQAATGPVLWTQEMKVRNGQSWMYAEPSGDHNPIHVDNDFAVKVGLPGIILQGLCSMAFAHKAVLDNAVPDRDPLKLRKLKVRFSRPVLPGQTLTFQGYALGDDPAGKKFGLIARNPEGKDVFLDAWFVVAK
jgi:acyl dehydratase